MTTEVPPQEQNDENGFSDQEKVETSPNDFRYYQKGSIKYGPVSPIGMMFAKSEINERGVDIYEDELGINCAELSGKDVLNLGSGAVQLFEKEIKEKGIKANVISLSPEYSNEEQRAKLLQHNPSSSAIAAIGQELPFRNESFDVVLVLHVTEHMRSWAAYKALFDEISRVLRSGGVAHVFPVYRSDIDDYQQEENIAEKNITISCDETQYKTSEYDDVGGQKSRVQLCRLTIQKY